MDLLELNLGFTIWDNYESLCILWKIDFLNTDIFMIKKKFEQYLKDIIKDYPNIPSGRKNYYILYKRVKKQISLTKKYKLNLLKKKIINKIS